MKPIRIFISSVQKELELERAAIAALISTDPFLLQHCVPVLFEKEPPPSRPGYPLKPLTLARLRKGSYRPCSRNPLIAQTLATLMMMEQRGTGFARMRDAMLNHGLDEPVIAQQDGFSLARQPGCQVDCDCTFATATLAIDHGNDGHCALRDFRVGEFGAKRLRSPVKVLFNKA